MAEYEDWGSARIAQLEQEDLERYQRDVLRNSSYSYDDETPNYVDEFQSKLSVLIDLVRGLSQDLKRTTSSIENGPEPPTMNLHSDVGYETTDDLHSDEELVVNKFPDSKEMMDSDDIKGNEFSNAAVLPDCEENKLSKSGFKVLSIYCAHMDTKWRPVLDSQPIQGNDMSVEVYYDHFFNWKRQLEEVNYIGGEESYVDDFIYGLEIRLGMRVCGYKWKPHTLYGAFRRAVIEESLMKNDADMMFEEMPHPNSINDQGTEDVSDGYDNVSLDSSLGSESTIKVSLIEEDNEPSQLLLQKPVGQNEENVVDGVIVPSLFDLQVSLGPLGELIVNGSDNGSTKAWHDEATLAIKILPGKYVIMDDAYKEFDEMAQEILASLLDEEVISAKYAGFNKLILFDPGGNRKFVMSFSREVARPLFGKARDMFVFGFKAKHNIDSGRLGTREPSMADYKEVAMEMVFREMMVLMFDPGISSLFDGIFRSLRATRVNEQVNYPYTNGFSFNNIRLFDPGGDRNYALSCVNGMKGSISSLRQIHSTIFSGNKQLLIAFNHFHTIDSGTFSSRYFMGCHHFKHSDINQHFSGIKVASVFDFFAIVWDPGRCASFIYILEDKDVFEPVKKDVSLLDFVSVIMSNWCSNSSHTHVHTNGLVNTLFSLIGCFWCDPSNSEVCQTYWDFDCAFIWLSISLEIVEWGVLNNIIVTSYIEVNRARPAMFLNHMYLMLKRVMIGICGPVSLIYIYMSRLSMLICCSSGQIVDTILFPVLYKSIVEFNDSLHVIFSICPEGEQDGIHCITFLISNDVIWARIAGSSKKARGVQNNYIIMEWCVMASMHYLDEINGMDGNVLATIYHSCEFYLASIVKGMVLVNLKGFVWDPGTDFIVNCVHGKTESTAAFGNFFDTSSFVTKAVRRGVSSLVLRDVLVIVPCVQWYDYHVRVMSCSPHNIQIIETFSESVEMVILKGVELTLQTGHGWSVWWKAIFLDIALILCLYEAFCQIKIWNSLPKLQINMSKERNMLHALIEDPLITNAAITKIFVFDLFPRSYASYALWQCHTKKKKNAGTNYSHLISFWHFKIMVCFAALSVFSV